MFFEAWLALKVLGNFRLVKVHIHLFSVKRGQLPCVWRARLEPIYLLCHTNLLTVLFVSTIYIRKPIEIVKSRGVGVYLAAGSRLWPVFVLIKT
jgi:hypothetical protein